MFSIKQVPRSENKKDDALSKIASTSFAHLSKQVLVEELKEKSINEGIDIAGPFPEGPGKVKFLIVAIDYFTKWIEAKPVAIVTGYQARLDARSKNLMEEISHVLWAHRTMIKSSNEDIPFSLTYGTEAVILAKIGKPTLRTEEVDMVQNDEALEINLDLLEERREQAAIHEAKSKAKMEKYYNSKVHSTSFKPKRPCIP
ncbi:reverse transcriptase domain-containing protein [Tanacetum coccineum]